jgi:hypothetical protein
MLNLALRLMTGNFLLLKGDFFPQRIGECRNHNIIFFEWLTRSKCSPVCDHRLIIPKDKNYTDTECEVDIGRQGCQLFLGTAYQNWKNL